MRAILLFLASWWNTTAADYFVPTNRVSGLGVAREEISKTVLAARTDHMIQSQTFGIMREPEAIAGAKRITDPKLQQLFRTSAQRSGIPVELVEAVAYLESWGDPKAESPTGPKGIMQITSATARTMGLRIVTAKKYRVTRERVRVRSKSKKPVYKTVRRRIPYTVVVRDERMIPARAVPAAANYLAGMIQKFGGEDWALFAYHCGQGCVSGMMELTRRANGIPKDEITVPRMFFSSNPSWNRDLYEAIQLQMQRDYSPTYYFRVKRAQQLLALYRRDPAEFTQLAQQYRAEVAHSGLNPNRAPHRLSVWLKRDDLVFRSCDDIRADAGKRLVRALDQPDYFGYRLNISPESPADLQYFQHASPSAVGALTYIAYETRRLYEDMKPKGEKWVPLSVTSLVAPEDYVQKLNQREGISHCSGQVFDIDFSMLPSKQLEALRFVLNDLGWGGFLGFVEESRDSMHIGCSPAARDFFANVFQEAMGKKAAATAVAANSGGE